MGDRIEGTALVAEQPLGSPYMRIQFMTDGQRLKMQQFCDRCRKDCVTDCNMSFVRIEIVPLIIFIAKWE